MRPGEVVEVDDIQFGRNRILVPVFESRIVGNQSEIGEFEVVEEEGKTFFDLLRDDVAHHVEGFSGSLPPAWIRASRESGAPGGGK